MGKKAALLQIRKIGITEKIAKLSETDIPQLKNCIEQAVLEDQKPPLETSIAEKTLSVDTED